VLGVVVGISVREGGKYEERERMTGKKSSLGIGLEGDFGRAGRALDIEAEDLQSEWETSVVRGEDAEDGGKRNTVKRIGEGRREREEKRTLMP
jgi:hypothetical protein